MTRERTASPRTAGAINDRIALEILAERGPLTAAQLKESIGLSRPSVSDLVGRLRERGLVTVVGEGGAGRRGPNARLYGLIGERAHVAALDVRTDHVSVALADLAGRTVHRADHPVPVGDTPEGEPGSVALAVVDGALRTAGVTTPHTLVMGAPGLIDPATGALDGFLALPAWHRELARLLRERGERRAVAAGSGEPVGPGPEGNVVVGNVVVENEVNLAAVAEHRLGAVRDRDTFVLLWLGEGIGASLFLDGALRRGASGGAGEIGFLPVPGTAGLPTATDCGGGFHALVGGAAVREAASRHGLVPGVPGDEAPGAAEEVVARAVATPDEPAHRVFLAELAERVAVGAAAVVAVLDPGCVVLGGEVGRAGGTVLAKAVAARLGTLTPLRTEVRAGTVSGSPVLGGGLVTALDAARRELFTRR
ncbi:ROK family transcriptional regulator [Streptomyces sp. ST2-7A]|uniref:ROK family transcriptional regulator n=1 Tax=Streptomyces sp. ST2-7A TaxID=2907214 RepID=UPI001F3F9450|nr:ROK family transcriptional regulator [Streptomyces sp. ST2-7A]MCE7079671.1 ROK family transcriptional regulator [Streptomyces sp. ST2-7A]